MRKNPLHLALLPALLLTACNAPDTAALEKGDAAFAGETVDGAMQPAAARAVRIGTAGREADACGALATPASGTVDVRWTNRASSPAKAQLSGEFWVCESDGGWSGVVFPATGQDTGDCNVASPVASPREYQGPCRWGWVPDSAISVTAG